MDINTANTNNSVFSDSLGFLATTPDASQNSAVAYYNTLAANTNTSFNSITLLSSILNPIQDPSKLSSAACAMLMGNTPFNSTNLLNSIFNPFQDPSIQMTSNLQNFFSPFGTQPSSSTSSSQDPLGLFQQSEDIMSTEDAEAGEDIESEDLYSEEDIENEEK